MRAVPPSKLAGREFKVPGSISNLGAGFDALAVAVRLYLRVRIDAVDAQPGPLHFRFVGGPPVADNYIERALRWMAERHDVRLPGMRCTVRSDIPLQAGLGSSGAALVAGMRLFAAIVEGPPKGGRHTRQTGRPAQMWRPAFLARRSRAAAKAAAGPDLLDAACALEGHPDNVSAAFLGGLVSSCQREDGGVTACAMPWPDQIRFVVLTPEVRLETTKARGVLPETMMRGDAVFNLQRAALFVAAAQRRDRDAMREAMRDRWHQPFRAPLVPGLTEALALEHPDLIGVCLSGAGPSIAALAWKKTTGVERLLRASYRKTGIACTVRTLRAHQPESGL